MTKHIKLFAIVYLFLSATSSNSQTTTSPVFPNDAWGVYSWTSLKGLDKTNAPLIKGGPMILSWSSLEPQNGKFEFEKEIGDKLKKIDDNNFYTFLKIWIAPATTNVTATDTTWSLTPKWLFSHGVPLVEFPTTPNPLGDITKRYFPHYLDKNYKFYFHRMIDAVGKYVLSLPPHLRKRILYVQSAEGSTGDGGPYKGEPVNSAYKISNEQWTDFRLETWIKYKSAFSKDGVLQCPLLTNYDANNEKLYDWMLKELPNAAGLKNGMFSHGYQISDAQQRLANFIDFRNKVEASGKVFFARGEMDKEYNTYGWSTKNKKQAMYWSAIYATHGGLTMWNLPTEACMGDTYADAINFFNKHAAQTNPEKAKSAFCAFYRGLDVSDTVSFPESTYGQATKKNKERYVNIAKAFSQYGANQADAKSATGGGMENRKAKGYNDAGWQILKENFQRHITQIEPETTSAAWWQIDSSIYGRYARGFEPTSGKNSLYFNVDDKFFGASPLNGAQAIEVTITYRDTDAGSWELKYDATNGTMKTAMTVTNSGKGTDVWKTQKVRLTDAYLGNRGAKGADFILVNTGNTNCRFHMIAVDKISN